MKIRRKWISAIIPVSISLFLTAESVLAGTIQQGTHLYKAPLSDTIITQTYYYSDDYFKKPGTERNPNLLGMSFSLAAATFEASGSSYVTGLLEETGFSDVKAQDMTTTGPDTIGTVIAHKRIGDQELIAAAVRGSEYGREFASNVLIGETGNARGFQSAADQVTERILQYISETGLSGTSCKYWIAGFSRAGAVAELTGAGINQNAQTFHTSPEDIYIYAFESPTSHGGTAAYGNIFTTKVYGDPVTFVPPTSWGLSRNTAEGTAYQFGETFSIPVYTFETVIAAVTSEGTLVGAAEDGTYFEMEPEELTPEDFQLVASGETMEAEEFLAEFTDWLGTRLTRGEYAQFENELSDLLDLFFSMPAARRDAIFSAFGKPSDLLGQALAYPSLILSVMNVLQHNSAFQYDRIAVGLADILTQTIRAKDSSLLSQDEAKRLKRDLRVILPVLGPVIVDDYYYFDGIEYDQFYAQNYPLYNAGDEAWGRSDGEKAGNSAGRADAILPREKNPNLTEKIAQKLKTDYGDVYVSGYSAAYSAAYQEAYENQKAKLDDLKTSVMNLIFGNGSDAGMAGADSEYTLVAAPASKNLFHFATLIMNIGTLIKNHYPQVLFDGIRTVDDHYSTTVPDWPEESLVIPAGVTEIGEEAFAGSQAAYVVIPSSVNVIGERAFADCPNLQYIYIEYTEGLRIPSSIAEGSGSGEDVLVIAGHSDD